MMDEDRPIQRYIIPLNPKAAPNTALAGRLLENVNMIRGLLKSHMPEWAEFIDSSVPFYGKAFTLPKGGGYLLAQTFEELANRYFYLVAKPGEIYPDHGRNVVLDHPDEADGKNPRRVGGPHSHNPEDETGGSEPCSLRLEFKRNVFTAKDSGKNTFSFTRKGHVRACISAIPRAMPRPDGMDSGGDRDLNNYTVEGINLDRYRQGCFLVSVGTGYDGGYSDSLNLMEDESRLLVYFDGRHGTTNIKDEIGRHSPSAKEKASLDVRSYSEESGTPLTQSYPVSSSTSSTSASLRLNRDYDYVRVKDNLTDFNFGTEGWEVSFSIHLEGLIDKSDGVIVCRAGLWKFIVDSGGYAGFYVYDTVNNITGNIRRNESQITGLNMADFAKVKIGDAVSGQGIASGTKVVSKDGTDALTISQPATATLDRVTITVGANPVYTWTKLLWNADPLEFYRRYDIRIAYDADYRQYSLYIDGNPAYQITSWIVFTDSSTRWFTIGAELDTNNANPQSFWRGNIGDVVVKRLIRDGQNQVENTFLQLDCFGEHNSASITDTVHRHSPEPVNRAKLDSSYGTHHVISSIKLNRDYDHVLVSSSNDWKLESGFLLECLAFPVKYPSALTQREKDLEIKEKLSVIASVSGCWKIALSNSGNLALYDPSGEVIAKAVSKNDDGSEGSDVVIPLNKFTKITFEIRGTSIKFSVNGISCVDKSGAIPQGSGDLVIGAEITDVGSYEQSVNGFFGNIESFRISKSANDSETTAETEVNRIAWAYDTNSFWDQLRAVAYGGPYLWDYDAEHGWRPGVPYYGGFNDHMGWPWDKKHKACAGDGGDMVPVPGKGKPPKVHVGFENVPWNYHEQDVDASMTDGGIFKSVRKYQIHNNGLHIRVSFNHTGVDYGVKKMAIPTLYNFFRQRWWGMPIQTHVAYMNLPWQYLDRYETPYVRTHIFIKVRSASDKSFPLSKYYSSEGVTRWLYFKFDDLICYPNFSWGEDGFVSAHSLFNIGDIWKSIQYDFSGTYAGRVETQMANNSPVAGSLMGLAGNSATFKRWRPVPNAGLDIELVLYVADIAISSWPDDSYDRRYEGEVPEYQYWWKEPRLLFIVKGMSLAYYTPSEADAANQGGGL
ncbi:MAG: hypothetical protein HQK86_00150 [Nitrospinae bacterium]|nr:hypothetical protein [Nitrospinota bacterium]MBF0634625.1 hypothetical protein [Nitrospinota bacterium]